jgi:hypothetical protein
MQPAFVAEYERMEKMIRADCDSNFGNRFFPGCQP